MATAPQLSFSPEFATTYRGLVLAGLDNEIQTTARVLAAVPDDQRDYRPDPKARSAFELAWHIAVSNAMFLEGISDLSFQRCMEKQNMLEANPPKTVADIVSWQENNVRKGVEAVARMTPQQLLTPIDFFGVFNLPAFMYLQFLVSHNVHHRGQLAVYLRPMGSKVPSVYGGSADEPFQM